MSDDDYYRVQYGSYLSPEPLRMNSYLVKVKTAPHVEVKRSWIYEDIQAENSAEARRKATALARKWWGLKGRDVVVVSVEVR